MKPYHEPARMHGKYVTATQSCRTNPFLVVLSLLIMSMKKKDMEGEVGNGGMRGIQAARKV
jgi:hypothetical protein